MDAAVVKFNALADAVGASAQNHYFGLIGAYRVFVFSVVGGEVVSTVRRAADMDAFPGFLHTQLNAAAADVIFRDSQNLA